MSGIGNRFRERGYDTQKYLLPIFEKPIIKYVWPVDGVGEQFQITIDHMYCPCQSVQKDPRPGALLSQKPMQCWRDPAH